MLKKSIVGILVIIIAIAGIIGWEMFGREQLMLDEILVLNQDVEPYTEITVDMLATTKVSGLPDTCLTVEDYENIVGKQSVQYIARGSELYSRYFKDSSALVNRNLDEYVYSIPTTLITAWPRSIQAGDHIFIYSGTELVTDAYIMSLKDANGIEVYQTNDRTTLTGVVATIEVKVKEEQLKLISNEITENSKLIVTYN